MTPPSTWASTSPPRISSAARPSTTSPWPSLYAYATIVEGLTLGVWSNLALDDSNTYGEGSGDVSEVDLSAEYALPTGKCPLGVSVLYTEYLYPNTITGEGTVEDPAVPVETDREVGLELALNTNCALDNALSPTLAVYYGLDGAIDSGIYGELGLATSSRTWPRACPSASAAPWATWNPTRATPASAPPPCPPASRSVASLKVTYVINDDDVIAVDEEVVGTLGLSKTF